MTIVELENELRNTEGELAALPSREGDAGTLAKMWAELSGKATVLRARLASAMDAERRARERAQAARQAQEREALIADLQTRKTALEARWLALGDALSEVDARIGQLAKEFGALTRENLALAEAANAGGVDLAPVDTTRAADVLRSLQRGGWLNFAYFRAWGRA